MAADASMTATLASYAQTVVGKVTDVQVDTTTGEITMTVNDDGGVILEGASSMREISRDPETLLAQTMSEHHYPDGFVLFLGTLFAPTQDRDAPGLGFTHHPGDIVRISTPLLGTLQNRVTTTDVAPPWRFGISQLMANLASRGLIGTAR